MMFYSSLSLIGYETRQLSEKVLIFVPLAPTFEVRGSYEKIIPCKLFHSESLYTLQFDMQHDHILIKMNTFDMGSIQIILKISNNYFNI